MISRKQVEFAFEQADEWTESQIKSPAFMKLQQALRIKWGGVLVFTCPYGSGKSVALKDLTARMRADKVPVKYLDARKNARNSSSACHFLFTSLGLPMAAADARHGYWRDGLPSADYVDRPAAATASPAGLCLASLSTRSKLPDDSVPAVSGCLAPIRP